jgi:hypothetical protein
MSALASLEANLDNYLVKRAPQIPEGGREFIVNFGPWIAVVIVLIAIPAILAVVSSIREVGIPMSYWVVKAILLVQAVILAFAIPKLIRRERRGWELLFYYQLLAVVTSLISWLPHFDLLNLFWSFVGDLIGFYIIFQIRSHYR